MVKFKLALLLQNKFKISIWDKIKPVNESYTAWPGRPPVAHSWYITIHFLPKGVNLQLPWSTDSLVDKKHYLILSCYQELNLWPKPFSLVFELEKIKVKRTLIHFLMSISSTSNFNFSFVFIRLDHYMSLYDIQTLAMLSCMLWTKSIAQLVNQPPASPRPEKENMPPNVSTIILKQL